MNTMLITDKNRSGYMTASTEKLCVKAEPHKDGVGYCALFYFTGRSVAMGRTATKAEMQDVIDDMVKELYSGTAEYCFPWDEVPVEENENEYEYAEEEEGKEPENPAPEAIENKSVKPFEVEA